MKTKIIAFFIIALMVLSGVAGVAFGQEGEFVQDVSDDELDKTDIVYNKEAFDGSKSLDKTSFFLKLFSSQQFSFTNAPEVEATEADVTCEFSGSNGAIMKLVDVSVTGGKACKSGEYIRFLECPDGEAGNCHDIFKQLWYKSNSEDLLPWEGTYMADEAPFFFQYWCYDCGDVTPIEDTEVNAKIIGIALEDGELEEGDSYLITGAIEVEGEARGLVVETGFEFYGQPLSIISEFKGACGDDKTVGIKFDAENEVIRFKLKDKATEAGKRTVQVNLYTGCGGELLDSKTLKLDVSEDTDDVQNKITGLVINCANTPSDPSCDKDDPPLIQPDSCVTVACDEGFICYKGMYCLPEEEGPSFFAKLFDFQGNPLQAWAVVGLLIFITFGTGYLVTSGIQGRRKG